jgi:pullulanase/glycogen debranching enzyme
VRDPNANSDCAKNVSFTRNAARREARPTDAEADHRGPTLSMLGIDNAAYYRLGEDRRHYVDFTGCGNSLNVANPHVLQLIMDSLRYWLVEMHVDGFRFDLASGLARDCWQVDRLAAFFDIIHQDPVISQTKLMAEPWDSWNGGYQVGNFPGCGSGYGFWQNQMYEYNLARRSSIPLTSGTRGR